MAFEASWTHDSCLGCDNETYDGAYCSQACRLADMRKGGTCYYGSITSTSTPPSPFSLPPAFDFSAYRKDKGEAPTPAQPSSKRSSITSISSSPSDTAPPNLSRTSSFNSNKDPQKIYTPEISEASRQELRRYENLFDTNRHRRHRQQCF